MMIGIYKSRCQIKLLSIKTVRNGYRKSCLSELCLSGMKKIYVRVKILLLHKIVVFFFQNYILILDLSDYF
jgi:hypothetical protein